MTKGVTGYSSAQVALHWTVVVLVAFQFLAHDGIVESWRAYLDNKQPPADDAVLTYMHIGGGMLGLCSGSSPGSIFGFRAEFLPLHLMNLGFCRLQQRPFMD